MPRTKQTPADKTLTSMSIEMLENALKSSGNAGQPSNTNEHSETVVPNPSSETVGPSAGETDGIVAINHDPIPPKSDERTVRKREMRAMIDIISKDHGK